MMRMDNSGFPEGRKNRANWRELLQKGRLKQTTGPDGSVIHTTERHMQPRSEEKQDVT
jgi:hypothetical protein